MIDDRGLILILGACFTLSVAAGVMAYVHTRRRSWLTQASVAAAMTTLFAWDALGLDDDSALLYRRLVGVVWVLVAGVVTPLLAVHATANLREAIKRAQEAVK